MKAAIYNGKHDVFVTELETPVCGERDVLLRTLHAGICGSDVSAFLHGPQSHLINEGGEFGHEVVAEVAAKGSAVTGLEIGDRVYPYPLLVKGDPLRAGTIGGFSEYILVPNCEVDRHVYKVSDRISTPVAGLIEPFTVANRAVRCGRPQAGESAIVFGSGTIGIGVAVALKRRGLATVLVVDLSDFRLSKAAEFGFVTCNPGREDLRQRAIEVFGAAPSFLGETADVDLYVEATGADSMIGTYQEMAKSGSRMVVVGVQAKPVPVRFDILAYGQQELIGAGGYQPDDVHDVMSLMESGEFDLASIITHEYPLDRIVEAITQASDRHSALNVAIAY